MTQAMLYDPDPGGRGDEGVHVTRKPLWLSAVHTLRAAFTSAPKRRT